MLGMTDALESALKVMRKGETPVKKLAIAVLAGALALPVAFAKQSGKKTATDSSQTTKTKGKKHHRSKKGQQTSSSSSSSSTEQAPKK
jgi:hypothetical protein